MIPSHITVTFPFFDSTTNKILVIKAIRGLTRMGLKESKDLSEKAGPQTIKINPYQMTHDAYTDTQLDINKSFDEYIRILKDNKVTVCYDNPQPSIDMLQQVAISSIKMGNYEMAIDVMNLIRKYS